MSIWQMLGYPWKRCDSNLGPLGAKCECYLLCNTVSHFGKFFTRWDYLINLLHIIINILLSLLLIFIPFPGEHEVTKNWRLVNIWFWINLFVTRAYTFFEVEHFVDFSLCRTLWNGAKYPKQGSNLVKKLGFTVNFWVDKVKSWQSGTLPLFLDQLDQRLQATVPFSVTKLHR